MIVEQHVLASIANEMRSKARELQLKSMSAEDYWGKLAEIAVEKYKAFADKPA